MGFEIIGENVVTIHIFFCGGDLLWVENFIFNLKITNILLLELHRSGNSFPV